MPQPYSFAHDTYARSVVDHAADGVIRDIAWLDDLIAAERVFSVGLAARILELSKITRTAAVIDDHLLV